MILKYKYNGQEYSDGEEVRQAIGRAENKAFGAEPKEGREKFWAALGVEYSEEAEPELTAEQKKAVAAAQARIERDRKLAESDYFVMPDYPAEPEDLAEVKEYRQALRDISAQEGFPENIEWPDEPAALHGIRRPSGEEPEAEAGAESGTADNGEAE